MINPVRKLKITATDPDGNVIYSTWQDFDVETPWRSVVLYLDKIDLTDPSGTLGMSFWDAPGDGETYHRLDDFVERMQNTARPTVGPNPLYPPAERQPS
jgi:hypothetical protein